MKIAALFMIILSIYTTNAYSEVFADISESDNDTATFKITSSYRLDKCQIDAKKLVEKLEKANKIILEFNPCTINMEWNYIATIKVWKY